MDLTTAIVVIVASVPGLVGLWYSLRMRSISKDAPPVAGGTDINLRVTESAFRTMENQVRRLTEEQRRAGIQRDVWELERRDLLTKIDVITERMNTLQAYVRTVVSILEVNGIPHPRPPE